MVASFQAQRMTESPRPRAGNPPAHTDVPTGLDASVSAYQDDFAYALDNRLMLNWYPQRIMRLAKGRSLLELGLGHGYSSLLFSRHFPGYTVIEGSNAVIARFRESHPDARLDVRCAYFENFVADTRYDHIVMGFILEHVDDPAAILRRYRQFLAPQGSLFVAVPNCEALNKRFGYAAGMIDNLETLSEADRLLGHQRLFTLKSLTELCQREGFSIESVEGIFLKPIATGQIQELRLSEPILQAMLKVGVDYPELSVGILMELRVIS
jgi:2-polyprenyl-3-methyl-5-hydroxy-6-metoxy-1,4-benzoquinol methylase